MQNSVVKEILGRNSSVETLIIYASYIVGLYARRKYNVQHNGFKTSLDMFLNFLILGISRLRGVVMYELQSTLSAYARRKFSSGEISVDHLKNILKEVRKYLKECIQIFSYEPTCIQEGRLAAIARLDLVELETYVDSVSGGQKISE